MTRLAVIGAAALGRLIAHHARTSCGFAVEGFYDDAPPAGSCDGLPVFGSTERIEADHQAGRFDVLAIGVGYRNMSVRAALFERFVGTIPFGNVIHPSCYVDISCTLGRGVVLLPGTTLDMGVRVDDNVLLNTGVVVAHHARIGRHSFLAPGVQVAGLVTVGAGTFMGTGATVIDQITIAPGSVVGAGAVVIRDTPPRSVSVGVPARVIRTNA